MAKIRADQKNYKKAFEKHLNSYLNGENVSDPSKRLLLAYCVECGLKYRIMEKNRIQRVSQANIELSEVLGTHDMKRMLKELGMAGTYRFKNFTTEYGDNITTENYHQMCRYAIEPKEESFGKVKEFELVLSDIAERLSQEV